MIICDSVITMVYISGILLEWEDTFPFSGILAENRNSDAYTVEEVRDLLKTAKSLNLDIIPLVPTFGHLEWILKVEKFRQYRQNDMFPQVQLALKKLYAI